MSRSLRPNWRSWFAREREREREGEREDREREIEIARDWLKRGGGAPWCSLVSQSSTGIYERGILIARDTKFDIRT